MCTTPRRFAQRRRSQPAFVIIMIMKLVSLVVRVDPIAAECLANTRQSTNTSRGVDSLLLTHNTEVEKQLEQPDSLILLEGLREARQH
jgi:hypothetical protein